MLIHPVKRRYVALCLLLGLGGVARASNYALEEIPMLIPADEAGRLRAAGAGTTFALLDKASDPRDRKALATEAHVSFRALDGWLRLCDLMRVRGVGPDVARLLTAVGVLTVTPNWPSSACASSSFCSVGNSLTHGAHQLAHRLTSTGTPLDLARLKSPPSGFLKIVAGAASPLWLRSRPLPVSAGSLASATGA